jgi:lipoprotein-releasing system permease protein
MKFELFVARRYLTAKRKQAFISVITLISIVGIAIGVMALVIAISLITGFHEDVQGRILGASAHLTVSDLADEGLPDDKALLDRLRAYPGIVSVSPVVWNWVLIGGRTKNWPGSLKAVDFDLEKKTAPWLQKLDAGALPGEGSPDGLLLGRELAMTIGAIPGDTISVVTSSARLSPIGLVPKTKRFRVSGIVNTGLYEFDSTTALIPLETGQKLMGLKGRVTYYQIRIADIFEAARIGREILPLLPPNAYVTTWMDLNRSLYSALKLEKTIMFLTIALIVLVASLNIIATLILMVMEKIRDIGILMAMGATRESIQRIFFLQGALIGTIGTALGVGLGLGWCWLANTFRLIKIPVDIYQISFVPFRLRLLDFLLIVGVSLSISFLSTLFPSHRAAKTDPVTALKYE